MMRMIALLTYLMLFLPFFVHTNSIYPNRDQLPLHDTSPLFTFGPDKLKSVQFLNTGENILLIDPTLRYAHKNGFLTQVGVQFNIGENLRNRLNTIQYVTGGFIAYTF